MPTLSLTPVAENELLKPSTVNTNYSQIQTVVNSLDLNNISTKYAGRDYTFTMVGGQTVASFAPHTLDGNWYIRGWCIEPQGFEAVETATFTLSRLTLATGAELVLATSPAMVAGSTITRIDLAATACTNAHGLRVKVSAGAIPASRTVTITVHTAMVLMASSAL